MELLKFNSNRKLNSDNLINFSKIAIIIVVSSYFVTTTIPYYEATDGFHYAIVGINLINGSYEYTNDFLQNLDNNEFIPAAWGKTINSSLVPGTNPGLPALAAFSYYLAGTYGLFYLGPVMGITYLIVTERIATKLFGSKVGLITLIFLSMNANILMSGQDLMTELLFSSFLILGCYYLIIFLQNKNEKHVLMCSLFFVFAAVVRLNGIPFLPAELLILTSFFLYQSYAKKPKGIISKRSIYFLNSAKKLGLKKKFRVVLFISLPWIVFFLFWFSYNDYYFDHPLRHSLIVMSESQGGVLIDGTPITMDPPSNFLAYLRANLPYPPSTLVNLVDNISVLSSNWLGLVTAIILISSFTLSIKIRQKRTEIFIFTLFILTIIISFSLTTIDNQIERGVHSRYAVPSYTLFSVLAGFLFLNLYQRFNSSISLSKQKLVKIITKVLLIIFVIFLLALIISLINPSSKNQDLFFNVENIILAGQRYPIDQEGITEDSIIVYRDAPKIMEFGAIPFSIRGAVEGPMAQNSMEKLKELIRQGHDVYNFKLNYYPIYNQYFYSMIKNHNIVFEDYSESFCKLGWSENINASKVSDKICLKVDEEGKYNLIINSKK